VGRRSQPTSLFLGRPMELTTPQFETWNQALYKLPWSEGFGCIRRIPLFLTPTPPPLSPIAVLPPIQMVVGVRPTCFCGMVLWSRRCPRWRLELLSYLSSIDRTRVAHLPSPLFCSHDDAPGISIGFFAHAPARTSVWTGRMTRTALLAMTEER